LEEDMTLNRKLFDDGLEELVIAFNIDMTPERADVWYNNVGDIEDHQWQQKIKNCIRNCRKVPTLADILDNQGWYKSDELPYQQKADISEYEIKIDPKDTAEARARLRAGLAKIGIRAGN
jgi:hypothetical protein